MTFSELFNAYYDWPEGHPTLLRVAPDVMEFIHDRMLGIGEVPSHPSQLMDARIVVDPLMAQGQWRFE